MKKSLITALAVLLLLLTACQPAAQTPAAAYLADRSEQEILDYFEHATLLLCDFADPREIPADNLFTFVLFHEMDSWFNQEDRQFYIPLTDIYAILDEYLADYSLPEEWFAQTFGEDYDAENRQLILSATGMGTGCAAYDFVAAETVDADNIRVTLLQYCTDPEVSTDTENLYITAKIVEGQAKFTSYEAVANK